MLFNQTHKKEYVKLGGFLMLNRRQYLEQSRYSKKPEATKTEKESKARSQRNIQYTKGMIKRNPSTKVNSTPKLAKKLGISDFSARKILHKDLGKKLSEATEGLHGCKRRTF
uniref:Uncharacterized protein n=1 Tax=Acrobeloides nanus TaxID=290746 RepID=A0A914BVA0_9BILA